MTVYVIPEVRRKTCLRCRETRTLDMFARVRSDRVARRSTCKPCQKVMRDTSEYREKAAGDARAARVRNPLGALMAQEKARQYGRTVRGRANRLFLAARHRATVKGVPFSLQQEWVERALEVGVCARTGVDFDFSSPAKGMRFNPYAPSIDRKDPFGAYSPDNTQIVCNAYNLAKHQFSDAEFLAFCQHVVATA